MFVSLVFFQKLKQKQIQRNRRRRRGPGRHGRVRVQWQEHFGHFCPIGAKNERINGIKHVRHWHGDRANQKGDSTRGRVLETATSGRECPSTVDGAEKDEESKKEKEEEIAQS